MEFGRRDGATVFAAAINDWAITWPPYTRPVGKYRLSPFTYVWLRYVEGVPSSSTFANRCNGVVSAWAIADLDSVI